MADDPLNAFALVEDPFLFGSRHLPRKLNESEGFPSITIYRCDTVSFNKYQHCPASVLR